MDIEPGERQVYKMSVALNVPELCGFALVPLVVCSMLRLVAVVGCREQEIC